MKKENRLKDWFTQQPDFLFKSEKLTLKTKERFEELRKIIRGDIITMTTVAGSGHPGGAMSSADIFIIVYSLSNTHPDRIHDPLRDRIVVSHGHTSAGVYSILGRLGFFDIEEPLVTFRKCGSIFEGHIEREVPGCEWSTGNLGQGLSAACGFALSSKIKKRGYNVFVLMSDAEQAKGQVAEARRFAKKFGLNNITVLIDYNQVQISGSTHKVMNVNIKENYISDGWKVIEIDGHNYDELYSAIRESLDDKSSPYAILSHTIMGKGVPFMEEAGAYYHGKPLPEDKCSEAFKILGIEGNIDFYKEKREKLHPVKEAPLSYFTAPNIRVGKPIEYQNTDKLGNRDAFGKALQDIAEINKDYRNSDPIAVFDCDLKESVRSYLLEKIEPKILFESGVQEHNTATVAGVVSIEGILTYFADFGVFGLDEVYNQQRLNTINHTNLKVVITHSGINVGKDGKTHHCIDFLGLVRNLPGFKLIIPADPNQTDRVIRYISQEEGNFFVVTGRTKNPVISDMEGKPLFGKDYIFNYGTVDIVRKGNVGVVMSYGPSLERAINAWDKLKKNGINIDIWNVSSPLDISADDVAKAAKKGFIITYEDHLIYSGLGDIVGNKIAEAGICVNFKKIGIKNFSPSGTPEELYKTMGIDEETLIKEVTTIQNKVNS